ncbi:putative N-acetyltransferase YhbS [Methanococcus maripaludis]|uniref:Putative N-acetyltransferase YhbS n=1 Tax=Methanococcus maripaludis TaxID=39152 RepID=A0A7J9S8K6_METMI|nr:N-acetyltransferase [Methanococcus maripaludis]MBB6402223.1 putative N-acetyltransferase YhbS [Methanococcus maripaludis]
MDITIRLEDKSDFKTVENITREAFWDVYRPGCEEHLVLHKLRKTDVFIKELDFVALEGETIVGNIIYSIADVINKNDEKFKILCMGPISVLPNYQGKGIGTLLMNHSIKVARKLKYLGIIIFGNPNYYHRFGFKNAKNYDIQTSEGENFEEFMALELNEGSLDNISGKFYVNPVFIVTEEELKIFEKEFPYKEKHVKDSQLK